MQLRDSILMARQHAQKAMGASVIGTQQQRQGQQKMDFSALNINVPHVPGPIAPLNPVRDREVPQLLRRIRELEEEVRNMKSENEKQVRIYFFVWFGEVFLLIVWYVESDDNEVPGTVGQAERVC